MRARTKSEGFTLIELMVVVTIIAVVAALAAPAIGAGVRERNKNLASLDVVRIFRGARALSIGSGAAVLVRFNSAGNGTLSTYQGDTNRCNGTNWNIVTGTAQRLRDGYAGSTFDHGATPAIALTLSNPRLAAADFCFESSGMSYWRADTTSRMTQNAVNGGTTVVGGFQFDVATGTGSAATGVTRHVVVPLGADARIRR